MDCKRLLGFALAVMIIFNMAGCSSTTPSYVPTPEQKDDRIQIGLSIDSLLIERWSRERDLFVSKAQELGAEVNVQNANGQSTMKRSGN